MKTLSKTNADILGEIVDLLIPAKENLPSPTKINVVEHIDDALSNTSATRRIFVESLGDINNKQFLSLSKMEQIDLLEKYELSNGTFFFATPASYLQRLLHKPDSCRRNRHDRKTTSTHGLHFRKRQPHLIR